MRMQSQSLIRTPPSEEERLVIHEQFLRTVYFNFNLIINKFNHFFNKKRWILKACPSSLV